MKLSAWHKKHGDSVEWYQPMFSGHMDRVYMSKVFSFSPEFEYHIDADEVVRGGSGFAIKLVDGREIYNKNLDKIFQMKSNIYIRITRSMELRTQHMDF